MRFTLLLSLPFIISCATDRPFYSEGTGTRQEGKSSSPSSTLYTVYLIGDSRRAYENERIMEMLETNLGNAGKNSAVIFLGDNVQPR